MNEREHEQRRDDLAAFLVGALEPDEAADLERHVAGCEECQTELRWLRPAVQMLPESVDRIEPPRQLRGRIMEEVQAERGHSPQGARGRGRARSFGLRLATGLAAVLVIAAAIAGYAIREGGSGGTSTVAAGHAPGVTAKMVSVGDSGTLRLANVHQLPPDEILQAWVRRGKRVESAKTLFVPNGDGTATAVIDHMDGVDAVMVTAEPRGGSDYPTSEPIVSLSVPQ